jgi:predicted MFS family arabinose efflux permease
MPADEAAGMVPLRRELRRAAHSRSYRLLNAAFFVCGFHVTFIATHLASYAEDVGQTRSVAAGALALVGLFNIAGSLAAGVLGSRHSPTRLLSVIYASRALVIAGFVLIPASTTTTLAFGAAMGVLWLSTVPLTSAIVAGQFGTAHVGTLFGIVFLSHQLGAFTGALMGGSLADQVGSYDPVWWIAVALGIAAALLHLAIDEGPQPEPPPALRVLPRPAGGMAVAVVLAGSAALALGPAGRLDAAAAGASTGTPVGWCGPAPGGVP